ncbi:MAG: zinc ribbon domain-containing protein [Bacteroidota bacterium]
MPTYEYVCKQCGHSFSELQSITAEPLVRCPQCGKDALARAVGAGGGLIFKGSGFYLTDYKNSQPSTGTNKEKEKPTPSDSPAAPKSAPESKPGPEK